MIYHECGNAPSVPYRTEGLLLQLLYVLPDVSPQLTAFPVWSVSNEWSL